MKDDKESLKFFGEYCPYIEGSDKSKEDAKIYLEKWKEVLLYKLNRDSFHCEVESQQWVERPSWVIGALTKNAHLALKLCLKAKWDYELT